MDQQKLGNARNLLFIALAIDMAVTSLLLASDVWMVVVLRDVRSGVSTWDQSTTDVLDFWNSFGYVATLTMIGVGGALVRWLEACYQYAKDTLNLTGFAQERWIIWGWIIPGMDAFKPYQVLSEIHKAGAPDHEGGGDWKISSGSALLLAWWIFWVISHVIMWGLEEPALYGATRDEVTLDQAANMNYGTIVICVTSLTVASLWFVVAGTLTRRLFSRSVPTRELD